MKKLVIISILCALLFVIISFSGCTGEITKTAKLEITIGGGDFLVKIQSPTGWDNIVSDTSDTTDVSIEEIDGTEYLVFEGSDTIDITFSTKKNFDDPYPNKILKVYVENSDSSVLSLQFKLGQTKEEDGVGPGDIGGSGSYWSYQCDERIKDDGWTEITLIG